MGDPLASTGAVHAKDISDTVWATDTKYVGAPGKVDSDATALDAPSPAALKADTEKLCSAPLARPDTVADVAATPVPSYTTAPVSTLYTLYPVASAPVPESDAGADHTKLIDDELRDEAVIAPGAPGAVDCDTDALLVPSPAALTPLTANEYSRPPDKPPTTADVAGTAYVPTTDSDEPATPVSAYSLYAVTASPIPAASAVHDRLMELAFCEVLARPLGAAGAVDVLNTALRDPSPLAFSAATWKLYAVPPTSPVIDADVDVDPPPTFANRESYAVIVTGPFGVPSLRYTT
jgi:hypothetical protein